MVSGRCERIAQSIRAHTVDRSHESANGELPRARPRPRGRVVRQRERILWAMVVEAGERGFANCSVGVVISRAGVSRRTFYEHFDDLTDCFLAVLEHGGDRVVGLVSQAFVGRETWSEGLCWALMSLLVYFDSEPLLARVWLVESMTAGGWAIEYRERRLRDLLSLITGAWPLPDSFELRPLAIEGVYASVRSIVVGRVIAGGEQGLLIELLGPLMGIIAAPFLDERGVEREIERGEELARGIIAGDPRYPSPWVGDDGFGEAAQGGPNELHGVALPKVLSDPRASRVRASLFFLAAHPGCSNSQVAAGIGVAGKGQISALLARLASEQLAFKTARGAGKPNEWRLTLEGEQAVAVLAGSQESPDRSQVG